MNTATIFTVLMASSLVCMPCMIAETGCGEKGRGEGGETRETMNKISECSHWYPKWLEFRTKLDGWKARVWNFL